MRLRETSSHVPNHWLCDRVRIKPSLLLESLTRLTQAIEKSFSLFLSIYSKDRVITLRFQKE